MLYLVVAVLGRFGAPIGLSFCGTSQVYQEKQCFFQKPLLGERRNQLISQHFNSAFGAFQNDLFLEFGNLRGDNCRGRDDHHGSPPAQIRTSASTHTALTKDEWRRSVHRDRGAERGVEESTGSRLG